MIFNHLTDEFTIPGFRSLVYSGFQQRTRFILLFLELPLWYYNTPTQSGPVAPWRTMNPSSPHVSPGEGVFMLLQVRLRSLHRYVRKGSGGWDVGGNALVRIRCSLDDVTAALGSKRCVSLAWFTGTFLLMTNLTCVSLFCAFWTRLKRLSCAQATVGHELHT
jgi:hypothetical protein